MIRIKLDSFSNLIDIKGILNVIFIFRKHMLWADFPILFSKTELTEPPLTTLCPVIPSNVLPTCLSPKRFWGHSRKTFFFFFKS